VAILATTLEQYSYNRSKRKSDQAAPLWIPLILVVLYFIAAELLTVALDIAPGLVAPLAPAVFPVLSIAAFAVLAVRADHQQRLTEIEQGKADAKAERERRKQERTEPERVATNTEQEPTDSLPFICLVCGAQFATQAALNGHGNRHRTNNGRKPEEVERERQLA